MTTLFLADADAFGVVAVGAERRGAAGADPFAAALVPPLLLLEALTQRVHQLVEAAERFDLGHLLRREVFFGNFSEPFVREFAGDGAGGGLEALEDLTENAVEAVEVALVLDEGGAAEEVEILDVVIGHAGTHGAEQRQIFCDGGRHSRVA